MAKLGINTGSVPNDGTGDTLLAAALKINQNFNEIYNVFGDGTNISASIPYAANAGVATYATLSGVATYAVLAGVSTYSVISGVSTYATTSGVSTYAATAGISTTSNYSVISGVSTLSQGLTGAPNINVGVATASSLNVTENSRITGILTVGTSGVIIDGPNNIVKVGSGVTINGNTGIISATSFYANGLNVGIITADTIIYEGATLETYWKSNSSGINTSSNVGIGNTLPTSKLTVTGDARFTGVVTASSFSGNGSALSGVLKNLVEDATPELGGNLDINNKILYGTGGINITGVTTSSGGYKSGTNVTFDYDVLYATWGPLTTENFRIRTFNNVGTNIPGIEFATSREAAEIYVRQYSFTQNVFGAVENQVTLLNNIGNTIIYNNIGIGSTLPTSRLSVTGDGRFTGVVTAASFKGSSQIGLSSAGVYLGFATQFNFVGTGITLSTQYDSVSGIATLVFSGASSGGGLGESYWNATSIGIHTLSNVGVGTTNPTSKFTVVGNSLFNGISTFAGITTVTGTTLFAKQLDVSGSSSIPTINTKTVNVTTGGINVATNIPAYFGNTADGYISFLSSDNSFNIRTPGGIASLVLGAGTVRLTNGAADLEFARFNGSGATIYGTTSADRLSVSGVSTFNGNVLVSSGSSILVGSGVTITSSGINVTGVLTASQINGTIIGSIDNAVNLTGGTANASSLNVSGITTISAGRIQANASANLRFGNLPAGSGSSRNIAIGDQVLVSLSGGQGRNIGIGELSYYDTTTGQYNIGIGERAGQKVTSGAYNVILGSYDGNSGNLDIRTSSRNVVIADGEGNIRQYINSSGNVGIKTTVVTEALTVAGVVSATSFYGTLNAGQLTGALPAIDGSALIGVVGSGSGVVIQDDATPVGTAGTINFGSNLDVSFAGGTATVSGVSPSQWVTTSAGIHTLSNVGIGTTNPLARFQVGSFGIGAKGVVVTSSGLVGVSVTNPTSRVHIDSALNGSVGGLFIDCKTRDSSESNVPLLQIDAGISGGNKVGALWFNSSGNLGLGSTNPTSALTVQGDVRISGVITSSTVVASKLVSSGDAQITGVVTASSFSGSGSGLTNIPAGQLTGSLPAIDGSALLNVTAAGTGVVVEDDTVNVGSATTIDFGTGLDVAFSGGVATITASGGSLQSRTTVTGVTTSIANNGIGNTNITGFKSYALMKVGLSTAGWLRLYTDSASRAADVTRSQGEDPAPGSGVIAEVITTGISTTQIISPFVMGGNLDNPADTTIYAAITNLSGSTQAITATLTILQLEA